MKVRDLLTDESKWVRGIYALDERGNGLKSTDPRAVCWCLLGAINKCYGHDLVAQDMVQHLVLERIQPGISDPSGRTSISGFNDSRNTTFAEIRKLVEELDI